MNYPFVNRQVCGYCGACVSVCPENAIELVDTYVSIDNNLCSKCLSCVKVCPVGALSTDMLNPDLLYNKPSPEKASINVDVLIIGGGPAGSIAARTLAEQKLEVLMVEKRQEIGTPVRCAEGVSKEALLKLMDIDPKWVSAPINSGCIYAPNGNSVTLEQPDTGLVLERKIFDRDLAQQAARAGADIWVKARAVGIIKQDGNVTGAVVRRAGIDYEIKSKVVIAADGVESQIARWAGIDTRCKNSGVDTCVQYLMTGLDDIKPDCCCFYLGHEVAPRGYAWIFPKGNGSANVGIGIGGDIDNKTALDYLNQFVEKEVPGGSVLGMVVGAVPISGTISQLTQDGFMVIGDAAHLNDPVSGGGIINAMISGQIAGEVAGKAIIDGDVSRTVLDNYSQQWHKEIGRTFRHLKIIREGVLKFSDNTLNDIARMLSKIYSRKIGMVDLFWTALKNEPKLLLELRHLISIGWGQ